MKQKKHKNERGAVIGLYSFDKKTFKKIVDRRKHLLRIMDAWGIQSTAIAEIINDGGEWLQVFDKHDGILYEISIEEFKKRAVERDFGDGKQLFVSRKYFTTHGATNNRPVHTDEATAAVRAGGGDGDEVCKPEAGNHPTLFG